MAATQSVPESPPADHRTSSHSAGPDGTDSAMPAAAYAVAVSSADSRSPKKKLTKSELFSREIQGTLPWSQNEQVLVSRTVEGAQVLGLRSTTSSTDGQITLEDDWVALEPCADLACDLQTYEKAATNKGSTHRVTADALARLRLSAIRVAARPRDQGPAPETTEDVGAWTVVNAQPGYEKRTNDREEGGEKGVVRQDQARKTHQIHATVCFHRSMAF